MILLAAAWIVPLLLLGGYALDSVLSSAIRRNFDEQLNYAATALIATAEIGPQGEAMSSRPLSDQRFLEPYSGLYWQVSAKGQEPFRSRSLWDRALAFMPHVDCSAGCFYDSHRFRGEPLRVVERDAVLPGAKTVFHFQVAQANRDLADQVDALRETLMWSLSLLGLGLLFLAALQSTYGLWPLRKVSRAIAAIRSGSATRVPDDFPPEISPLVAELNALLGDNAKQAEAARLHAGNLAHALKTPMSVLIGAARENPADLPAIIATQTAIMKRHVDHQLARARAAGR
ncbi:MAG: sensor histidine kinase N-terminal domain-containing protein, partial [Janthinobacterium lividum]